jgi:hypothetical protein
MSSKDKLEQEILDEISDDDEFINEEFMDISDLGLEQLYITIDEDTISEELDRYKL